MNAALLQFLESALAGGRAELHQAAPCLKARFHYDSQSKLKGILN